MDLTIIPNPRSWPVPWQMVIMLGPCVTALLGMILNAYLAYSRDFDRMLSALQSSLWLDLQVRIWGTSSYVSRWILLGTISGLLAWPNIHIKRGQLDEQEVRDFPRALKCRLFISDVMMFGGGILFLLIIGLYKMHGL